MFTLFVHVTNETSYCTCVYVCRLVLDQGNISHNHKLGVFTVVGTTGNAHVVRIFPTESCTCSSTARCYHILAVRLSLGLEDKKSKRRINLTQLRLKTKTKSEKKSGRKAPRVGDYTVNPAPDAHKVSESQKHTSSRKLIWRTQKGKQMSFGGRGICIGHIRVSIHVHVTLAPLPRPAPSQLSRWNHAACVYIL